MSAIAGIDAVQSWIGTGLLGVIAFLVARVVGPAVKLLIESRRLKMEEEQRDRDSWAKLIETLNEQVSVLSGQVADLRKENDALRTEIRELHTVIDNLRVRENRVVFPIGASAK